MWIKALSKSLLIVVGVFAIVKAIELLNQFVMIMAMGSMEERSIAFWVKILSLVVPTVLLITGVLLIFRLPELIKNKICECADQCTTKPIVPRTVFHVVSVFLGFYCSPGSGQDLWEPYMPFRSRPDILPAILVQECCWIR